MLALINWPFGTEEKDPAELFPKFHRDTLYDYWLFRNRWRDADDVVVTFLFNNFVSNRPAGVLVFGLGGRVEMACPRGLLSRGSRIGADRSGVVWTDQESVAVDFSKASGAEALVIIGPLHDKVSERPAKSTGKAKLQLAQVGGKQFQILTLVAGGGHPEVQIAGDAMILGGQKVGFNGGKLVLSVFAEARR